MPSDEIRVFERINGGDIRVSDVTENVFQGLATSANYVYIGEITQRLEGDLVRFRASGHDEGEIVESSILKKVLKRREIDRWGVEWDGLWLVFPYDVSGDDAHLLSADQLRMKFPNAWNFFQNHEDELEERNPAV